MGKLEVEENRTGAVLPTNDDLPQTCKFDVLQVIYKNLLKGQFCSNLLRVTTASQQGSVWAKRDKKKKVLEIQRRHELGKPCILPNF